jgi:hypothetical protein
MIFGGSLYFEGGQYFEGDLDSAVMILISDGKISFRDVFQSLLILDQKRFPLRGFEVVFPVIPRNVLLFN